MQTIDKRVLVIGLGISGQSAVRFLLDRGAFVTGIDKDYQLLQSESILGLRSAGLQIKHEAEKLSVQDYDYVVVSPGVPKTHPCYSEACKLGIEILGEMELALRFMEQKKCIGITGTNGKTTVTSLVTHVLNESGIPARALGNIGTPLTSIFDQLKEEVVVLELSSFQLETMTSRSLDTAVLLNISPDHLDRYNSMQSYAEAKLKIANCLKPHGKLFVESNCWHQYRIFSAHPSSLTYGFHATDSIYSDLESVFVEGRHRFKLPENMRRKASHDVENLLASYALTNERGVSPESFLKALATFRKPPHRIEFVCTSNDISYYDDSKGTNIDAVIRAVQTLKGNIILIAGGVDKGAPYTPWIAHFNEKVKLVCAIGQSAERIKSDIGSDIPVHLFGTLEEAVHFASKSAKKGDNVLLSPGCSSYDMFRDYAHRGNEFQRIVKTQGGEL